MTEAIDALLRLERKISSDVGLDLLGGAAGCAVVALSLFRRTHDERLLAIARACGEHLARTATRQERGLGWEGAAAKRALAGFAHGAAGIAWVLVELAAALDEVRYMDLASGAVEYERTLFVAEEQNWLDLRDIERAPANSNLCAWCHGAAGVALGRSLMLQHLDDGDIREEIHIAVEQTLRVGFSGSDSLCHGSLGNLEAVLLAAERLTLM